MHHLTHWSSWRSNRYKWGYRRGFRNLSHVIFNMTTTIYQNLNTYLKKRTLFLGKKARLSRRFFFTEEVFYSSFQSISGTVPNDRNRLKWKISGSWHRWLLENHFFILKTSSASMRIINMRSLKKNTIWAPFWGGGGHRFSPKRCCYWKASIWYRPFATIQIGKPKKLCLGGRLR